MPRNVASTPVTVVEIDERSLARAGQWPWPRTLLAELIRDIERHDPSAIGIDILMPEPDRLSPERLLRSARQDDPVLASRLDALPAERQRARARHRRRTAWCSYSRARPTRPGASRWRRHSSSSIGHRARRRRRRRRATCRASPARWRTWPSSIGPPPGMASSRPGPLKTSSGARRWWSASPIVSCRRSRPRCCASRWACPTSACMREGADVDAVAIGALTTAYRGGRAGSPLLLATRSASLRLRDRRARRQGRRIAPLSASWSWWA